MDAAAFDAAQPVLDDIAQVVDKAFDSAPLSDVKAALSKLNIALGSRYSVSLMFTVEVCDQEKERSLPLLSTGIATFVGKEPYRCWGDSTAQRYVAQGEIQALPHDRCPICWELWDFKLDQPTCSACGATLGKDVKLLLDSDVCPHCEKGKLTAANPTCDQCGFEVDPDLVAWG